MKTIEAQLVISAQDKTGAALSKLSREIDGAIKTVDRFRAAQTKFADSRTNFRAAQQAVDAAARAMKDAATPTRELETAYRRAQNAVSLASRAFDTQKMAVIGAKRELESYGVAVTRLASEENRLQRASANAGATTERRAARGARMRTTGAVAGAVGSVAGGFIAAEAERGASASFETYREFDKERRFQKAVMQMSDEDQLPLVRQAIHGGATSKYNDIQWIEAQRELAARGLNKDQILGLTPTAANLGQALDLSLPDASRQLEGALFGFKKDMSSLGAAQASAIRTADLQTKAAKISGMKPEDITELYKYGATPARMAGVSEETLLAFGGISKKANMGGDESGVAFRALISAATAPTAKAKTAMLANGLNYSNYQMSPDSIALNPFVADIAAKYGVKLDQKSQSGLGAIFNNKQLLSDPALFAPAVTELLKSSLGGNDAKSLKSIAGEANRYRDASMKSPDVNRLITDLMTKMANNIPFANAMFGSKQGGRIATALGDPDTFRHMMDELTNHSGGFAQKIADERMSGFDGAVSRLEGALKNVETAIGRAWDQKGKDKDGKDTPGPLTQMIDSAGSLAQHFAELSSNTVALVTGMAGVTSASIGLSSAMAILGKLAGVSALSAAAVPAGAIAATVGGAVLATQHQDDGVDPSAIRQPGESYADWQKRRQQHHDDRLSGAPATPNASDTKHAVDLNVQVEPSESFISRITQAIRSEFSGSGPAPGAGVGTTGSTGLSMPGVVAPP